MHKNRLEAFSDGVIAIIITIMVLELKVPHGDKLSDLAPLFHIFISYVLSFVYLAIYWNNHHHLYQAVKHVNGSILWANIHLLFWLSLVPFATAWLGEGRHRPTPMAFYGFILLMAAIAFYIQSRLLVRMHGKDSDLGRALKNDFKGRISLVTYSLAIPVALYVPPIAFLMYILVAAIWFVPDRRIEKLFS